ncbi:ORF4 [Ullucus polerovirus 1]|uniref:ORF4 n=1 Tax=Ullucus polerovirus 1 TaxID=2491943 RepID=A0A3Q8PZC4_9VIRU|nr:ORF4 [Ullucus polerovirus 1]
MAMVSHADSAGAQGDLRECSRWLLSRPLDPPGADDVEDDVLTHEEDLLCQEEDAQARHSFSQRTISRAVPQEVSPSGRLFQTARRSVMEYSRPTMNIRSQTYYYSSSARPLPPPRVPSLLNWTPIAKYHPSPPRLTSSPSPKVGGVLSRRK